MNHPREQRSLGALCGLAAAVLFGSSPVLIKLWAPGAPALISAALLYLGAGVAVTLGGLFHRGGEVRLKRADLPALSGVVLAGGVVGPVLMLLGLHRLTGSGTALLLNTEAVFTILFAVALFGEHLSMREALAAVVILAGAAVLTAPVGPVHLDLVGALLVVGACAAWGLDNNLSQRLSVRSPVQLVRVKALAAAAINLALSRVSGELWVGTRTAGALLAVGAICYGVSIVLDVYALRFVGAAREAAYFATAPFVGALLALPLLNERLQPSQWVALVVLATGVVLLARARHGHLHTHEALTHEHLHVHDAHHQHEHGPEVDTHEPHAHPHQHAPLTHDHPHVSDAHHRHHH